MLQFARALGPVLSSVQQATLVTLLARTCILKSVKMAALSIPGMFSVNSMNEMKLKAALRELALGGLRFLPSTGSTNDDALAWATDGAKDMSLVAADEQTAGRGRMGRKWFTPPGSALAFSLIIRPQGQEREAIGRFSGLGALALVGALKKHGVTAQIKWPNDVLVGEKKIAGVLAETVWMGAEIDSVVLGIGVNVASESVPPLEGLNFPATCIQAEGPSALPRFDLLKDLLAELISLRASLASDGFLRAWEEALAFRNKTVHVWVAEAEPVTGQVLGLEMDGSLRVRIAGGEIRAIRFGEVHLRPL
jgi:BirA family transcriptional regulator, biotin operon repressor / biotin---[acetyl-CoA-carboxylase] ligase